jgi:hypothetical protein
MKIVVTTAAGNNICQCQFCNKTIARVINDKMIPSAEECYKHGNVPVPNFGWFCSQDCATEYEGQYDIKFSRTPKGTVDYYAGDFGS